MTGINLGKRSVFDVLIGHVGHDIQIHNRSDDVEEVRIWCNTCKMALLVQQKPITRQHWES